MIETLIKSLHGVLPQSVWDYIFTTLGPRTLKLHKDEFQGVQVSAKYVLVKIDNLK
jgi:hypothetical protein